VVWRPGDPAPLYRRVSSVKLDVREGARVDFEVAMPEHATIDDRDQQVIIAWAYTPPPFGVMTVPPI